MSRYLLIFLLILGTAAGATLYKTVYPPAGATVPSVRATQAPPAPAVSLAQLESEVQALQEALAQFVDTDPYLVIDTVHNRLQIRKADRILKEAVCATGSGKVLLGNKQETWHFNTPRKVFQVRRKVEDPIWKKPRWAFVERGRSAPILPWNFDRLDPTTLGKYALELGDGYEIHGTLYPNLLGRHITHGCIRLNDDDLETAYTLTTIGSRVYIY